MILPGGVSYAEVGGASAVSKVCVVEVGGDSSYSDAWLLLWEDGVSVHPVRRTQQTLRMELSVLSRHGNAVFFFTSSHLKPVDELCKVLLFSVLLHLFPLIPAEVT